MSGIDVRSLRGAEIASVIDELAALRIEVFAEGPYLYEGSAEYEARYLSTYAASPAACVVVASHDGRVVGAASAMPAATAEQEVGAALERSGFDLRDVFYFGESVLRREFRGRGLGHAFFDGREAAARDAGARWATFCSVVRPSGHPARPVDYRPHDEFWTKRGYRRRDDITCSFAWPDIGARESTAKTMVFWTRELGVR